MTSYATQRDAGTMARSLETVLLSLRKVLVIEDHRGPTYKCPSVNVSPWKFSRTLHSVDTAW